MPKISVCIPTFNREHFLPIAIEAVLAQVESDWELIRPAHSVCAA
jgi:glycosyltransferase involved in cell wall biosynthesis